MSPRVVALTTGGAFEVEASAVLGRWVEPGVAWMPGPQPVGIEAPLLQALLGLGVGRLPRGPTVARYWLRPRGDPPAALGASADAALALAVLVARRRTPSGGTDAGTRVLTGSGRFVFSGGEVRLAPVEGWAAKLDGLATHLAAAPASEVRVVCAPADHAAAADALAALVGVRVEVIPAESPDEVEEALAGWVEAAPPAWPGWPRPSLRGGDILAAAERNARQEGRAYVSLLDLRVAAGLADRGQDPRLPHGEAEVVPEPTPLVLAVGAELPPGFRERDLAGLLRGRDAGGPAGEPAAAWGMSQTGSLPSGSVGECAALIVVAGPEEGLCLTPGVGETIGRHRTSGGPDRGLYRQRALGVDILVHGLHLRWLGAGRCEALHALVVEQAAALAARRCPVAAGEIFTIHPGDTVWLSPQTGLRAVGAS